MREKTIVLIQKIKSYTKQRWFRWIWRSLGLLFLSIILLYVGMAWYINRNKPELLKALTENLNHGLHGTVQIKDMEPAFLVGFPKISLRLRDVTVRDSLFPQHKRTLLTADDLNISVNALALLRGAIDINQIKIQNATINLYTDSAGYSNTEIFPKKENAQKSTRTYPRLNRFSLVNVRLQIDNQHKRKLYNFHIRDLTGKLKYSNSGWDTSLNLDTQINSMAFSTTKGSFALQKNVSGKLQANYDETNGIITVYPANLSIGGDDFQVSASFGSLQNPNYFAIHIRAKEILWRNASTLLSPNISSRLNLFELSKPIKVGCDIVGDFSIEGDPLITVRADVANNQLHTSGGSFSDCSFTGYFSNQLNKSAGINDVNSAITLKNFKADYSGIPILMSRMQIANLENPIARGDFKTKFEVSKLNRIFDKELLAFSKGTALVDVKFIADVVNYEISKPHIIGKITINDGAFEYVPRKMKVSNVAIAMNFADNDLLIPRCDVTTGRSVVKMDGKIDNFLNLYYSDPEKIVLKWNVASPQLHLSEFLGFLGPRHPVTQKVSSKGNFTKELDLLFDKSNVNLQLAVDRVIYNAFLATDLSSNIVVGKNGISVKDGKVNHASGNIRFSGNMIPTSTTNNFKISTKVSRVNIATFFKSFNNFSLESLKADNLEGRISVDANLSGKILSSGALQENSLSGNVNFSLQDGALVNFEPIKNVGKYAFPFRNFDKIDIYGLQGNFKIDGEKVQIEPMKINSSLLNMNLEGIYSFGRGTKLYVSVPVRNPSKDQEIIDKQQREEKRMRGLVINLTAADDDDGKVKISLGKK